MLRKHARILALLLVVFLVASIGMTGCAKKEPLKLTLICDESDTAKKYAAALQEMWRTNLGIEVTVEPMPFKARLQKMQDKDFQILMGGWGPDYNDPMTFLDLFVTNGGNNHSYYSNATYDKLISDAKKEVDKAKRMGYLYEAEKLIMKELPIIPLYFRMRDWTAADSVKNVVRRAIGGDPDLYWTENTGNALKLNYGTEPPNLDPQKSTDTVSFQIINGTFEGLYRFNKDGSMMPGMAEKYEVSADGKVYTFTIREGAKWSNGDPVTADDFLYAVQRAVDPKTASEYAYILYDIKGAQEINEGKAEMSTLGVKADGNKLTVTLNGPVPYFLSLTAFGTLMPCNRKYFETVGEEYAADADKLIFNGPWKITEWTHDSKLVLAKNDQYWNAAAIKLNTIEGYMIADTNTAANMFYNKELDIIGIPGAKRQEFLDKGYKIMNYSDGATFYVEINMLDAVVGNQKIREALSLSIDRAAYCKNVLMNDSLPALAFVPPILPGLNKAFRSEVGDLIQDYNVDEAKKLLAAGEKEVDKAEAAKATK